MLPRKQVAYKLSSVCVSVNFLIADLIESTKKQMAKLKIPFNFFCHCERSDTAGVSWSEAQPDFQIMG